jgi:lipid-binding SYLF domain-containing protein
MFRRFLFMIIAIAVLAPPAARAGTTKKDLSERLENARVAYLELRDTKEIPDKVVHEARCIAVFPGVVKAALGFGARHGKGVMSCRDASGHWGPPVFMELSGGSLGFQIGVEKADVVLFFMTDKSVQSILESKFSLGAKAGVAAGPVGRTAEASTDVKLNAEIYSYARSKGAFAGLSLEGAKIAPDNSDNSDFYGKSASPKAILVDHKTPGTTPVEADAWMKTL